MMSCIVLVLVLVGVVMSSGSSDEYEELDPFDMVNFDHVKMKMRKVFVLKVFIARRGCSFRFIM